MPVRLAVMILLFLGGFMFPLLFLPAALLAWSIFADWATPDQEPLEQLNAAYPSEQSGLSEAAGSTANVFEGIGRLAREASRRLVVANAVNSACSEADLTFETERSMVDGALKIAHLKLRQEDMVANNPDAQRAFDEAGELLRRASASFGPDAMTHFEPIAVREFMTPPMHPDAEINEQIQMAFQRLAATRSKFFHDTRRQLHRRPRLQEHVKDWLTEQGWDHLWTVIRPIKPTRPRPPIRSRYWPFSPNDETFAPDADTTDAGPTDWANNGSFPSKQTQADDSIQFSSYREALEWARECPSRKIVRDPGTGKWKAASSELAPGRSRPG